MVDLPADVEQQLRDLPDTEWSALAARVRPPDTAERFREIAATVVPADQLDSFMSIANPAAFASNGAIDEARVREHLGRIFGAAEPPRWGQSTGQPVGSGRVGAAGRAALEKRHGVKRADDQPAAGDRITRGAGARAEIAKRYGGSKK